MVGVHELCRETKVLVLHKLIFLRLRFERQAIAGSCLFEGGLLLPPPNATLTLNTSTAGSRAAGSFQPICHHPPRLLILFTLQKCWNNRRLCPHPSSSSSPFIEDVAGLWYIIQRSRIMQKFTLQAFPNNHLPEMRSHSLLFLWLFFACSFSSSQKACMQFCVVTKGQLIPPFSPWWIITPSQVLPNPPR